MRLWSLHPKYLDRQGLVALWREALLAQAVLLGKTKGYKNHPQLERFKSAKQPIYALSWYLSIVWREADNRNYKFDAGKIHNRVLTWAPEPDVTSGQIEYESYHLHFKLEKRDVERSVGFLFDIKLNAVEPHPLFKIVEGPIEPWEKIK